MDEMPHTEYRELFEPRRSRAWLGWLVVALGLGVAGYGYWRWKLAQAPAPVAQAPAPPAEEKPAAPPAPPMEEGDALLRKLAAGLSTAKELTDWLGQKDILRQLVAAVNLVSEGKSPRPVLPFLAPKGEFTVVRRKRVLHASPRAYARYTPATRVVTSIDPSGLAKVVAQLRPYIDAAYSEIGPQGSSFSGVLHEAIQSLAQTPIPGSQPALKLKGIIYVYKDPKLEGLSGAQKQLLRMGPANARAVQAWLTRFDEAFSAVPVDAAHASGAVPTASPPAP